ncbi:MAG: thiamine-phosphate synthase family protein [Candidatus Methanomethylicaceae archaeon]
MVKEFIPTLRALIAKKLYLEGWTQQKIADVLGITQVAVAKYIAAEIKSETWIVELSERILSIILKGVNREGIIAEVCRACLLARNHGPICEIHRKALTQLSEECAICPEVIKNLCGITEDRIESLRQYSAALNTLIKSVRNAHLWIPEVRTNLVFSPTQPSSVSEIIGIPGRISEYKGKIITTSIPLYGGSEHLAIFLIEIAKNWRWARAACCLKNTPGIQKLLNSMGVPIVAVERNDNAPTIDLIPKMEMNAPLVAISDPGFFGIEPVIYLISDSIERLVSVIVELDKKLEESK